MTKTVDISGMDESRKRYGYEWGCQVLMFRALHWLKQKGDVARFHGYEGVAGLIIPDNAQAKELETFALDHPKLHEFGVTGAMMQFSIIHALQRFRKGEEKYFAEFADSSDRIFEFDEADAFPKAEVTQ